MLMLNHGLLLLTFYLTMKVLHISIRENILKSALFFGYLLLFTPIGINIKHGQVGFIFLDLLLGFWIYAGKNRSILAGAMLALTIVFKVYPILLLPFLLLKQRYREVLSTAVWVIVISIGAIFLLPTIVWSDWLFRVIPLGGYGQAPPDLAVISTHWNYSIYGFFAYIFTQNQWHTGIFAHPTGIHTATIFAYGAVSIVIALSCLALFKARTSCLQKTLDQIMMIGLPLMFLIAPLSWTHHGVYLIPAMAALVMTQTDIDSRLRGYYYGTIGVIFLIGITGESLLYLLAVLLIWGLNMLQLLHSDLFNQRT